MKRNFDIFLPMILKLNQSFKEMGQLWLEESVFSEKKKKRKKENNLHQLLLHCKPFIQTGKYLSEISLMDQKAVDFLELTDFMKFSLEFPL